MDMGKAIAVARGCGVELLLGADQDGAYHVAARSGRLPYFQADGCARALRAAGVNARVERCSAYDAGKVFVERPYTF